eukprot:TRINITY_DN169_c0_g1_i12.p2 TRINITY_DN169_c0_g1~~TRINITY_DN169_c0_g1_i12.p2  ORF type:complete len:189 (+),score=55.82 TRINITY_DN169_c0_g1_i12:79-645(+)
MSKTSLMVLMLAGAAQGFGGWHRRHIEFTTFADGRPDGGIRQSADVEDGLDSPGDIFVFDQKLLADDSCKTVIGRNAGYCIRTDPGKPDWSGTDHPTLPDDPENNWGQCTWTLTFYEESGYEGTLQVSGRESDMHTSYVSIIGGTGDFKGAKGVLATTPEPLPQQGILFRQELDITLPRTSYSGWSGN